MRSLKNFSSNKCYLAILLVTFLGVVKKVTLWNGWTGDLQLGDLGRVAANHLANWNTCFSHPHALMFGWLIISCGEFICDIRYIYVYIHQDMHIKIEIGTDVLLSSAPYSLRNGLCRRLKTSSQKPVLQCRRWGFVYCFPGMISQW